MARGRASTSANVTAFLTEWLRVHAVGRIASSEDIPVLVSKCLDDASRQGITRRDLERAVGPLEESIRMSLRPVRKSDRRRSRCERAPHPAQRKD